MKKVFYLTLPLLLCACIREPQPDCMLSDEAMAHLFSEIHLMESCSRLNHLRNRAEAVYYYRDILDKYGMSVACFDSCLCWYSANPERFKRVYEQVVALLDTEMRAAEQRKEVALHIEETAREIPDYLQDFAFPDTVWSQALRRFQPEPPIVLPLPTP